jgi:putative FmdB family regulatory protein
MPIYAYRCTTCGHAQDVLRKISDPPLNACPACGAATFVKQVTAAGFQLKGSGWYVTDFRGDKKPAKSPDGDVAAAEAKPPESGAAPEGKDKASGEPVTKPAAEPASAAAAAPAPAPAAAPAAAPALAPASKPGKPGA